MDRRAFVRTVGGGAAVVGLAGCTGGDDAGQDDVENETDEDAEEEAAGGLTIVTNTSIAAGERPVGPWLEEAFAELYPDAEIDWLVPENGVQHYVKRARQGVDSEADLYLGLSVADLVRIDAQVSDPIFLELDRERVERAARVADHPALGFGDPHDRVLPVDTGYLAPVSDETAVDAPRSFEGLREAAAEGGLALPTSVHSDVAAAFCCWTVAELGPEDAVEYWESLRASGVEGYDSWSDAYPAYLEEGEDEGEDEEDGDEDEVGEEDDKSERDAGATLSYSTDRVAAVAADRPRERHRVTFLDGSGYATPEGVAIFADSERVDLAYAFVDFLLSSEAQARFATRNAMFPAVAVEHVALDETFVEHAREPPDPVVHDYEALRGNLLEWLDAWEGVFGR